MHFKFTSEGWSCNSVMMILMFILQSAQAWADTLAETQPSSNFHSANRCGVGENIFISYSGGSKVPGKPISYWSFSDM